MNIGGARKSGESSLDGDNGPVFLGFRALFLRKVLCGITQNLRGFFLISAGHRWPGDFRGNEGSGVFSSDAEEEVSNLC